MSVAIEMKKDNYGLKMLLLIAILFSIMSWMFYKIQLKEPVTPSFTLPIVTNKPIYILKSYATAVTYQKNGLNKNDYTQKIDKFDKYLKSLGYKTKHINEDAIKSLAPKDILFMPDTIALSSKAKKEIKAFIASGGNLFFNYSSGFSNEKGKYIGENFVSEITKLKLSPNKNFVDFKEGIFLTQRLLSPLTNENSGILLEASAYDPIPIYMMPKNIKADILYTNYAQANPPLAKKNNYDFLVSEAGMAWHGYYGKGKWFYMSLPTYMFYDSASHANDYKRVLNAIINYLAQDEIIQKFPYIDKENIIFVSEDTEYKFQNFKKFSDLAQKYKIPVTAFLVSSLAEKKDNVDMVKKISKNPFVEFGSHSHMHKKIIDTNQSYVKQEITGSKSIIDKYATKPIIGFRPPREELDSLMIDYLKNSGYRYILGKTESHLYPRFDKVHPELLVIPRHGTDDYSYLINLDWDQKQIVDQIKKETEFVTALDGIFTLSIHTHLFAYSTNINIVEKYFKYLLQHPEYQPLNGYNIAKRVVQNNNIDIKYNKTGNLITLSIKNRNTLPVENFTCKLFKNPNVRIKSIKCNESPGGKNTKRKDAVNIRLKYLKPNSTATIFIELEGTT
jgi:peptidoglycan/xylan/chitin deacetylase (PgdA/CDA1 family)